MFFWRMYGILPLSLIILNLTFWVILAVVVALIKLILPFAVIRRLCFQVLIFIHRGAVAGDSLVLSVFSRIKPQFEIPEGLSVENAYIAISNHRSWSDILLIQWLLHYRTPILRVLVKQELLYTPIIGLVIWAFEYPRLKRYSKAVLAKHPEKRYEDLNRLKKEAKHFRQIPATIVTFIEGTRFYEKKADENSEYKMVLPPKTGGFALLCEALGDMVEVLDITIVYDNPNIRFWDFLCGIDTGVRLRIDRIPITEIIDPKAIEDGGMPNYLARQWLIQRWKEKDRYLQDHYGE